MLPSFENAVAMLLASLGVGAPIITILLLVWTLKSWLDIAEQTVKGARHVSQFSRRIGQNLRQMPRARVATSIAITALVAMAQLLTVFMCYLFGNFIAMYFKHRQAEVSAAITEKSFGVLLPQNLWSITHFDAISGTYTVIAVLIIALSYLLVKDADGEKSVSDLAKLMALPATLVSYLAMVVLVVMGGITLLLWLILWIASGFSNAVPDAIKPALPGLLQITILLVICLLFKGICKAALKSSKTTLDAWNETQVNP